MRGERKQPTPNIPSLTEQIVEKTAEYNDKWDFHFLTNLYFGWLVGNKVVVKDFGWSVGIKDVVKGINVFNVITRVPTFIPCAGVLKLIPLDQDHFAVLTNNDKLFIFATNKENQLFQKFELDVNVKSYEEPYYDDTYNGFLNNPKNYMGIFPDGIHFAILKPSSNFFYNRKLYIYNMETRQYFTKSMGTGSFQVLDADHIARWDTNSDKHYLQIYHVDFKPSFSTRAIKRLKEIDLNSVDFKEKYFYQINNSSYACGIDKNSKRIFIYKINVNQLQQIAEIDTRLYEGYSFSMGGNLTLSPFGLIYFSLSSERDTGIFCFNPKNKLMTLIDKFDLYNNTRLHLFFPEKDVLIVADRWTGKIYQYRVTSQQVFSVVDELGSQGLSNDVINLIAEYAYNPTLFQTYKNVNTAINKKLSELTERVSLLKKEQMPDENKILQVKIDLDTLHYFKHLLTDNENPNLQECAHNALAKFDNKASEDLKQFFNKLLALQSEQSNQADNKQQFNKPKTGS